MAENLQTQSATLEPLTVLLYGVEIIHWHCGTGDALIITNFHRILLIRHLCTAGVSIDKDMNISFRSQLSLKIQSLSSKSKSIYLTLSMWLEKY